MPLEKLELKTPGNLSSNIRKLIEIFPSCATVSYDEKGRPVQKIDFDMLKQVLADDIVDGPVERYRMEWPGKRAAILEANLSTTKTLRPDRAESKSFDQTKNIFIEGDNLDALKIVQESLLGSVKLIYIDPPYNTGTDLVYKDDFRATESSYLSSSDQRDSYGARLVANTESNGRFHSDWLSMIYPRLKVARNLLSDDGIIAISIDENERSNLQKICDEIFGESNFIGCFVWKRRSGAMDAVSNLSEDHEYVLMYGKKEGKLNGVTRTFEKYQNLDNDPRGPWIADNLSAGKPGGDTHYAILDPITGSEFWPPKGRFWPYSRTTMAQKIKEGRVIFPKSPTGTPMLKRFASEAQRDTIPVSSWIERPSASANQSTISVPMNSAATKAMIDLMGGKIFSFPKPVELIEALVVQATSKDSLVMDFFAGSATTAEAVLARNAKDGGSRRYILVQIPEELEASSAAFQAGFRTIADVSKERIRLSGAKALEGEFHPDWNRDVGFRVLKVDTSNMKDVYYSPEQFDQGDLLSSVENVKPDRTGEDLLFQVLVDWGVDLTLPISCDKLYNKSVFFVDGNTLVACFEAGISEELVKELALREPLRVVFRDNGFVSDAVKINVEQIFRQLSPGTEVKTI